MNFIDTHAHLNDEQLSDQVEAVLERSVNAGVSNVLCVGIDLESSRQAIAIAEEFDPVFAVVGIQPNYVAKIDLHVMELIAEMAEHPKSVAIGETGLDRYWDYAPFDQQQVFFRKHIELSIEKGLPFVVHMRDCASDIVELLSEYRSHFPLRGVMHSYTGDLENAHRCLEAGLHISFAGMVTYKNAADLRDVAREIPLDRILIETDSPYLSPHPHRGKRPNEPAMVVHTAACLAELHETSIEEFGQKTTDNAIELFRLPRPIGD